MYHIITHDDLDGYSAGYLVNQFLTDVESVSSSDITIHIMDYSKELDIDSFRLFDEVYITDFSLKPDVMNELLLRTTNIIWLDHHKTALDYLPEYREKVKGRQIVGMSGTALTYLYFYAPKEIMDSSIEEMENWLSENARKWINLVDAWDCWKINSKYRKESELLSIYMSNRLSIENIKELDMHDEDYLDNILSKGSIYQEYKNLSDKSYVDRYGFEITLKIYDKDQILHTYKALAVNTGSKGSYVFGSKIDEYDICIPFINNGEIISASLYSNKHFIDCGKICKELGGGGHKGAAGFTLSDENSYKMSADTMFKKNAIWYLKINDWSD